MNELQCMPLWRRLWRRHRHWLRCSNKHCPISLEEILPKWPTEAEANGGNKPQEPATIERIFRLQGPNGTSHAFVAAELAKWCWEGKFINPLNNQELTAYDIVRLDRAWDNPEPGTNLFARRYHHEWKAYDKAKAAHKTDIDVALDEWKHHFHGAIDAIPLDNDSRYAGAIWLAVLPMFAAFWNFVRVNLRVAQRAVSDTMAEVTTAYSSSLSAEEEEEDEEEKNDGDDDRQYLSPPAQQFMYAVLNCLLWESNSPSCTQVRGRAPERPSLFWSSQCTIPIHVRQGWLAHDEESEEEEEEEEEEEKKNNNNEDETQDVPPPPMVSAEHVVDSTIPQSQSSCCWEDFYSGAAAVATSDGGVAAAPPCTLPPPPAAARQVQVVSGSVAATAAAYGELEEEEEEDDDDSRYDGEYTSSEGNSSSSCTTSSSDNEDEDNNEDAAEYKQEDEIKESNNATTNQNIRRRRLLNNGGVGDLRSMPAARRNTAAAACYDVDSGDGNSSLSGIVNIQALRRLFSQKPPAGGRRQQHDASSSSDVDTDSELSASSGSDS